MTITEITRAESLLKFLELTMPQKMDGLINNGLVSHHQRMGGWQCDKIIHAFHLCRLDGDFPIIVPRQ
jgi:hypothetical protein